MRDDIKQVLISREQIAKRVSELARQITDDHASAGELTFVTVLTGAMIFTADLIRQIPLPLQIGLMTVSSYPGQTVKTQGSQVLDNRIGNLTGRHVLVIDDILDSGGTLRTITPLLHERGAESVKTCVLLRKQRPQAMDTPADYVGFDIPDEFVVGYGLDFDDYYRNLPDIVVLKDHLLPG